MQVSCTTGRTGGQTITVGVAVGVGVCSGGVGVQVAVAGVMITGGVTVPHTGSTITEMCRSSCKQSCSSTMLTHRS